MRNQREITSLFVFFAVVFLLSFFSPGWGYAATSTLTIQTAGPTSQMVEAGKTF